jgi:hypothetical protein
MTEVSNLDVVKRIISFDVGIKNLAYIAIDFAEGDGQFAIHSWGIMPLMPPEKKVKQHTMNLDEITRAMYTQFQGLFGDFSVPIDAVLIENQPAMKNPVMKSIQMLAYSYFQYQKCMLGNPIGDIRFMSAQSKLKVGVDIPAPPLEDKAGKGVKGYRQNKHLAIYYATHLLPLCVSNWSEYSDMFGKHKKKDDLCDAFLQAVFFMKTCKNYRLTLTKE